MQHATAVFVIMKQVVFHPCALSDSQLGTAAAVPAGRFAEHDHQTLMSVSVAWRAPPRRDSAAIVYGERWLK
jgi:hypothetical protein